jgi:hypothetical protein
MFFKALEALIFTLSVCPESLPAEVGDRGYKPLRRVVEEATTIKFCRAAGN